MQNYEENLAARVNGQLQPLLGVSITVKDSNGIAASLYSDDGVTPLPQPLVTDTNGYFGFYAPNGRYTLTFTGSQIGTKTRSIELYDKDDAPPLTQAQAAAPSAASTIGYQPSTGGSPTTVAVALDGKADLAGPKFTGVVGARIADAGSVSTPVANVAARLSVGPGDGSSAIIGSRTRLVIENTQNGAYGADTAGGRIFVDGVRSSSGNMDLIIGLNDVSGNPPIDALAIRGNGTVELLRAGAALKAPAFIVNATTENRKVVFFGSSVCLGVGSTQNSDGSYQGWAYRLTQKLTALGYTCINKGVGGNTTIDLLNRFYTDVVPQDPDVVVIALSLVNEGIAYTSDPVQKEAIYQQYLDNMFKLVGRCRKLGYRVIVTGVYPNNAFTDLDYSYAKQFNEEMENTDVPFVNFLGAADDGTGKWRSGMYVDNTHPNDIGHEALSRAFPATYFERLPFAIASSRFNPNGKRGVLLDNSDSATANRIGYVAGNPFGSFTFMTYVRRNSGAPVGKAILAANSNNTSAGLRIRNSGDYWNLADTAGNQVLSTKNSLDGTLDHLAFTYNYYTATASFYVNGSLVGTMTLTGSSIVDGSTYFSVASRPDTGTANALNHEFRDIALYRTALNPLQIKQAANGWYPKASLEIFSPCFDPEFKAGYRLANLAPTAAYFKVNGTTDLTSKSVE